MPSPWGSLDSLERSVTMKLEPIITSLLDTDLYKFNMDQVIFHKHTDLNGEYYFKCRISYICPCQESV